MIFDPVHKRPDAWLALTEAERARGKASDDLCAIALDDQRARFFVRCVLPVAVDGQTHAFAFGLWVEVPEAYFVWYVHHFKDPAQGSRRPIACALANDVPGVPSTLGAPVLLLLVDERTRPQIRVPDEVTHPFLRACRDGMSACRASALNRPYRTW